MKQQVALNKPKIAIACQGGGSETAFTAGVLKSFLKIILKINFKL